MQILNKYKSQLGLLIAKGHAKFGLVAARRPYRDEDDTGEGAPDFSIEEHPLLAQLPVGAASKDLTAVASENSEAKEEALDRAPELTPSLQNQLTAELGYSKSNTPKPSPL